MTLRERISTDLKQAMRDRDATRLSTLRLISAAIKDRDIALRGEGDDRVLTDAELVAILTKMVKQRQDSMRAYEEGGRLELVERERSEIAVIEGYLPRQLNEDEITAAVDAVIARTGASSIRDMGRVIALLKERHAGQMDFGKVGPLVKARLAGQGQA
ncbi:MAG: GatB/YqeY domain-containing protein [Pararhodobacter sp.]|nr:GatB/YqeY domain-containing protein [Pararhodobacter sp.]